MTFYRQNLAHLFQNRIIFENGLFCVPGRLLYTLIEPGRADG